MKTLIQPHSYTKKPSVALTKAPSSSKRVFDILFSILALVLFSPLLILLCFFIPFVSPGPAVYACQRVGRNGRPFTLYKFRTMHLDAEELLKPLLEKDPQLKKEWQKNHKLKSDPRIIPFGSFIRKASFDELLQFFNVIKGDMSVVGPRPYYAQELKDRVGAKASIILSHKPGLTGLWQVSGRSHTTFEKRVELDERYIHTQNFWSDMRIVFKTITLMLTGKGAY